jgi:hypothetical protein
MTPMVAATRSTANTGVATNANPARSIRIAPAIRTRRRPIRSACVVSQRETPASPRRVSPSRRPTSPPDSPIAARYSTSTTARKPYPNMRRMRVANSSAMSGLRASFPGSEESTGTG